MAETTSIEWTHHTWSPWWGCTKVSDGCKNCYADTLSNRWGFKIWGQNADRRFFGEKHWNDPIRWNRAAQKAGERRRVFPSMCDPFEDRPDLVEPRYRMFDLIEHTPWLDWLLVTKRPENIKPMWPLSWLFNPKPVPNVWLLTSIEDQKSADLRIPELLKCRGLVPILGLSAEPLLSPIDYLASWLCGCDDRHLRPRPESDRLTKRDPDLRSIDWVIAGGESGPHARPMHPNWARSLRDQCQAARIPFFFKQWGEYTPGENVEAISGFEKTATWFNNEWSFGREDLAFREGHRDDQPDLYCVGKKSAGRNLDGRTWAEFPVVLAPSSASREAPHA